ncbi:uncharacterized protein PODANS_3_2970 [Podospora anserina S mat+]|uniref:Podospora anserina S mat+ genomic DNA chromosome 3, supercontig 2 n=1 Tax=Podospora anserina (strain S / ATCC MYA-4624 / DSM 980 / FGSC 10383) TaxID=515849 RepID=B2AZ94_PODAN|nr:uncharacterized protein PODANS_3_2970 [Podospora anserina S mat+]CAP70208.1 unnamed protein product [Podospora anserina S mat+]CDP26801.1 Putative protein of unknown function [Podospora anserina S mat+]
MKLLAFLPLASASIVILPGGSPLPYRPSTNITLSSASDLLRQSAPNEFPNSTVQLLLSAYSGTLDPAAASTNFSSHLPSGDSFVRSAIQAWGEHLHLVLRPDEIWFTILTQMNFYMETHAEAVRHLFVKHQGQEVIFIEDHTWTDVLWRFKEEIQKRVLTPWLEEWIVPGFSTTTDNDVMTSTILMMGLVKAYFRYEGGIICGLPSVTLEGTREDWVKLEKKLERLEFFGEEPKEYKRRLAPIFKRFVKSWDEPDSAETKRFWNSIVFASYSNICGAAPLDVSGWITGFFYWDEQGQPWGRGGRSVVQLDGVDYWSQDITRLPVGYARAPFIMRDFGGKDRFEAYVAAGNLGKKVMEGWPVGYEAALERSTGAKVDRERLRTQRAGHATLRPLSAWMLYGPLAHNATKTYKAAEAELGLLASRTKANLGGTCAKPQE